MAIDSKQVIQVLKQSSLRITKSRLALANIFIKNKNKYLTSEEIYQKILRKKGFSCNPTSVYRNLAMFEKVGIVKKSEFHKDAARYKINDSSDDLSNHEHYFKCIKCCMIEPFNDCFIVEKEKELETNGYRNLTHHLEIVGICPSCS